MLSSKSSLPDSLKRIFDNARQALSAKEAPALSDEWSMDERVLPHYLTIDDENDPLMRDVVSNYELRAAVRWEFSRANQALRTIAIKHRELAGEYEKSPKGYKGRLWPKQCFTYEHLSEELYDPVTLAFDPKRKRTNDTSYPAWVRNWPWPAIWQSKAFPEKHWIQLSPPEKKPVLFHLRVTPKATSLPVADLRMLHSSGVLRHFAARAAKAIDRKRAAPARIDLGGGYELIGVVVDQFQDVTTTAKQFAATLRASDDDRNGRGGIKPTKYHKEALRDLSAAFLYSSQNAADVDDWTTKNRIRDDKGKALRFYGSTRNIGPLHTTQDERTGARSRALKAFGEIFAVCYHSVKIYKDSL